MSLDFLRDAPDKEVLQIMRGVCKYSEPLFGVLSEWLKFCFDIPTGDEVWSRPKVEQTATDMSMVYMTETGHFTSPVHSPEQIWGNPSFAGKLKLVIYVPGWMRRNMLENEMFLGPYAAYKRRSNTNFVMFDTSKYYYDLATWETFDIDHAGMILGEYLYSLVSALNLEDVHLIGHSLGAHIAGAAARRFFEIKGNKLPRITALDPNILCDRPGNGRSSLRASDADFVDVIHTNPGVFGMSEPIGDVDFYVNGFVW